MINDSNSPIVDDPIPNHGRIHNKSDCGPPLMEGMCTNSNGKAITLGLDNEHHKVMSDIVIHALTDDDYKRAASGCICRGHGDGTGSKETLPHENPHVGGLSIACGP